MEIIYAVEMKLENHGGNYEDILRMDISCRNILAFSYPYLPSIHKQNHSSDLNLTRSTTKPTEYSFGIYICPLEQSWQVNLLEKSNNPVTHIVWDRDGKSLLVCHPMGLCRIYQMNYNCINLMGLIYENYLKEDIVIARCFLPKEPIVMNSDKTDVSFFNIHSDHIFQSSLPNHFICVTSSGTIHNFPLENLSSSSVYSITKDSLSASIGDLIAIDQGFHLFLSDRKSGATVESFIVRYASYQPTWTYASVRDRGFRLPSCYGQLRSLAAFQRNGTNAVLVHLHSFKGDMIDLYEYNLNQADWICVTLIDLSSNVRVTSIALSSSHWFMKDNDLQGLFGRQIILAMNDGLIIAFDKLNLKCREQSYPLNNADVFQEKSEYFVRLQHTPSGSCCLGFTKSGLLVLLRTIDLHHLTTPSMPFILLGFFEQYILQKSDSSDLWDILCLISTSDPNLSTLNTIIDRLVEDFSNEDLDFQRRYFSRFKECLFHLHRLLQPSSSSSAISEHLVSLLIYHSLVIVRDYARCHILEPNKRNLVDLVQEILYQCQWTEQIDAKQIKYIPPNLANQTLIPPNEYQTNNWIGLVDWISDILLYFISSLRSRHVPLWLPCTTIFQDPNQLQWLREFILYFSIFNKMDKIPLTKFSQLQTNRISNNNYQSQRNDIWKEIYQNLTNFSQRIDVQNSSLFDDFLLENLSNYDIDRLESRVNCLFPKSYPFLIPNCSHPQIFSRDQIPSYIDHINGVFVTNPSLSSESNVNFDQIKQISNSENCQTMKFDTMNFSAILLSSTSNFRRCIRCGNFTRIFQKQPYPYLYYQLNDRCLCGGLFLHYGR